MLGDLGIAELAADRLQRGERALLVRPRQPRIAGHIGGEDRGETAAGRHNLPRLRAHIGAGLRVLTTRGDLQPLGEVCDDVESAAQISVAGDWLRVVLHGRIAIGETPR
jgi:hypothetical protein